MKRRLLIAALAVALGACSDSTSPKTVEPTSSVDLFLARQRWRGQHIHDYQYTLGYDCFCVTNNPLEVTVRHDTIFAAVSLTTHQPVSRTFAMTVDDLFDVIEGGLKAGVPVETAFDGQLGYPRSIVYNRPGMPYDAGGTYGARDLRRGAVPPSSP